MGKNISGFLINAVLAVVAGLFAWGLADQSVSHYSLPPMNGLPGKAASAVHENRIVWLVVAALACLGFLFAAIRHLLGGTVRLAVLVIAALALASSGIAAFTWNSPNF